MANRIATLALQRDDFYRDLDDVLDGRCPVCRMPLSEDYECGLCYSHALEFVSSEQMRMWARRHREVLNWNKDAAEVIKEVIHAVRELTS